jgi:hypothetical protein
MQTNISRRDCELPLLVIRSSPFLMDPTLKHGNFSHLYNAGKLHVRKFYSIVFITCLLGCSAQHNGDQNKLSLADNPAVARQQFIKLVPIGTSRVDAEARLDKLGVEHSIQHGSSAFGNFPEYIYCNYAVNDTGYVAKRWQAALVLQQDRVVDCQVTFGLVAP